MALRVAINNIAVRRGLFFGTFIAGCVVVEAVIAHVISVGALGIAPATLQQSAESRDRRPVSGLG